MLVLLDERGHKHEVSLSEPMARVATFGTFDSATLRDSIGRRVRVGGKSFLVLRPNALDLLGSIERGPQTISPKDLGAILFEADIAPNSQVLEAGSGSGSLTVSLARAVGPSGRVISCDIRRSSIRLAQSNVERAGLSSVVEFREADVRSGIPAVGLDAIVLDMPDPWEAVDPAWHALRPCGSLAGFSPNMEQVKETVRRIRARPFVDIRTLEIIEREIEVRDAGVRPSFAPLGHTGYLTFARKVLDTF